MTGTAAGQAVRLLDRNAFSVLRMSKATHWQVNRRLCAKPQEGSSSKPSSGSSGTAFRLPGYKPTDWDKKMLLWTGRFKKAEDIPETLSYEVVDAARNKIRVKMGYLMIALTIMGCLAMVISGKRAAARHESLTSLNLERKARLREEAASSMAKP